MGKGIRVKQTLGKFVAIVALGWLALPAGAAVAEDAQTLSYGRFGTLTIYRPAAAARDFVLFVSGDGGWNLGVVSMAGHLRDQGAIVVGIDIRHYLAELEKAVDKCVSPDVDFENLSHYLQAKLSIRQYLQPTLVGYSSGATLVYATLAESPDGLFKGALSLGFCPDLDLVKPVCKGEGLEAAPRRDAKGVLKGVNFLPARKLSGRWISLQGDTDQVCPAAATQKFIGEVPGAEMVMLPKVGHGYSVERNWMPQYEAAYARITAAPDKKPAAILAAPVADLPLTVVEALAGTTSPYFAVFLSGDGGWVGLDRGVADELAKHGIPVVGWDSLQYFWSARTPQGASADLDRVLRHYASAWRKGHALLVGYSQGADTMPFMVNRLPAATRSLVDLTALLGISDSALFEFHLANWVGEPGGGLPTQPELARWSGSPFVCIYGEEDGESVCGKLAGMNGLAVRLPGGHHFGGSYAEIATQIIDHLPKL
ncbi:MAG: AcvB/VirJ family lysyl-phosphatidylglycerol hydrolase [Steroidobacterales bacterium]